MTAGAWTTHYQVCRGCGGTGELVTFTLREVRDFRGVERTAVVSTWQPCPDCKGTKWTVTAVSQPARHTRRDPAPAPPPAPPGDRSDERPVASAAREVVLRVERPAPDEARPPHRSLPAAGRFRPPEAASRTSILPSRNPRTSTTSSRTPTATASTTKITSSHMAMPSTILGAPDLVSRLPALARSIATGPDTGASRRVPAQRRTPLKAASARQEAVPLPPGGAGPLERCTRRLAAASRRTGVRRSRRARPAPGRGGRPRGGSACLGTLDPKLPSGQLEDEAKLICAGRQAARTAADALPAAGQRPAGTPGVGARVLPRPVRRAGCGR